MVQLSESNQFQKLTYPVICIVGPTASGKTDVSQMLAKQIDAEIISADSMQIYKGMDIGTGKIPMMDRVVPHHGLDLINPGDTYSAALFQEYARNCFIDIDSRGLRSILCGGTGFYVRAAIDDYSFPEGEQVNNLVREHYNQFAEECGPDALWDKLREIDPESAQCIHPNNVKRVVRAIELAYQGKSYAKQQEMLQTLPQLVPAKFFGLSVKPDLLNARINNRVDSMVENGLIEEVEHLLNEGFKDGLTAQQAIGYKEIVLALDGLISMEEAIEKIKSSTRKYAKRQRSWFRNDHRVIWINADDPDLEMISNDILMQLE